MIRRLMLLLLVSCASGSRVCDCASGCCDASGECRPGNVVDACGGEGSACAVCSGGQRCVWNACTGGLAAIPDPIPVDAGPVDAGSSMLVFNEICAKGCDYVELLNLGTATADVSGWSLSDSDTDGGPKVAEAVVFAPGTTVDAGARLLVLTKIDDGGTGATSDCLGSGIGECWRAGFGVSNSRGEGLWLLNASSEVVTTTFYPTDGHASGQSYSRIPDGTGAFTSAARTPGTPNAQ